MRADQRSKTRRIDKLELREVDYDRVTFSLGAIEQGGTERRRRSDIETAAQAEQLNLAVLLGRQLDIKAIWRYHESRIRASPQPSPVA